MALDIHHSGMLSYTTYAESGGAGKTTTASNLAVAHARAGLKPLVIPLDTQDGCLSRLMGVDDEREADVDTLAHHLVRKPLGDFDDLIRETEEGVHVIPEHNSLGELPEWLKREAEQAKATGHDFDPDAALLNVLKQNNVPERYDVLICDPPAKEGPHLYNALNATRSIISPIEPNGKGTSAVKGLEKMVEGLEADLEVTLSIMAVLPIRYSGNNGQERVVEMLEEEYDVPVRFRVRTALMDDCWDHQCSAYRSWEAHRRGRDYEQATLAKFDRLARLLESKADVVAPDPPKPGVVESDDPDNDDSESEVAA